MVDKTSGLQITGNFDSIKFYYNNVVLVTDGFTKTQHTIDYKYTIDKNDNCNE
jgi:hypothetical protein